MKNAETCIRVTTDDQIEYFPDSKIKKNKEYAKR